MGLPRTWALGCCGGIAARLLVLRQSFPRKQKQLAQQNKMHTGGVASGAPRKPVLIFLGGKIRRQLFLLLSPPATEESKSPQALLITHWYLEFPSPCCLDTELLAFPCNPKQKSPKNSSLSPSLLRAAGLAPGTWPP